MYLLPNIKFLKEPFTLHSQIPHQILLVEEITLSKTQCVEIFSNLNVDDDNNNNMILELKVEYAGDYIFYSMFKENQISLCISMSLKDLKEDLSDVLEDLDEHYNIQHLFDAIDDNLDNGIINITDCKLPILFSWKTISLLVEV